MRKNIVKLSKRVVRSINVIKINEGAYSQEQLSEFRKRWNDLQHTSQTAILYDPNSLIELAYKKRIRIANKPKCNHFIAERQAFEIAQLGYSWEQYVEMKKSGIFNSNESASATSGCVILVQRKTKRNETT